MSRLLTWLIKRIPERHYGLLGRCVLAVTFLGVVVIIYLASLVGAAGDDA